MTSKTTFNQIVARRAIESISSDGTDLYLVASTTQAMSRALSRVKLSRG